MSNEAALSLRMPARVVEIIDPYRIVINRGALDGVKIGQRLLVYGLSTADLIDPETGQNLGRLEIVRGVGQVTHVQDRLATVSSARTAPGSKRVVRRGPPGIFGLGATEEETIQQGSESLPFDDPNKGDYVRLV